MVEGKTCTKSRWYYKSGVKLGNTPPALYYTRNPEISRLLLIYEDYERFTVYGKQGSKP